MSRLGLWVERLSSTTWISRVRMVGDDLVHQIEEFDAPAAFVMASDDFPACKIERREQRRRSMPLVVVRLAGHGAPVRQFKVALRAFERLNRGLFVDRQNDGSIRRRHVETAKWISAGTE